MGGKDAFIEDQDLCHLIRAAAPHAQTLARYRLAIRSRLAHFVSEAGIDQLLVPSCDLPFLDEVHQVITTAARVVYASDDPLVVAHADAHLVGDGVHVLASGIKDPAALLAGASRFLDLSRPIAVLLINSLDVVPEQDARITMSTLRHTLAHGSGIAVVALSREHDPAMRILANLCSAAGLAPPTLRTRDEVTDLMTGLNLVEPGVATAPAWRPELADSPPGPVALWCALGQVPETVPKGGRALASVTTRPLESAALPDEKVSCW